MNDILPTRFGKYLLLEKIAVGGMAELYRARIRGTQGFEKLVAIKKLLSHLTDEVELVNAFIDEAKLAALLQHQNIVNIFDFGSLEGTYFIAMEHLFGKDLRLIAEKSKEHGPPLSLQHALYITSKICQGLDYAHNLKDFQGNPLNIIHRDISPQNILITYDGEVKIVDFGIAKAAGQNTKTRDGVIKGKVSYMSPEQASGETIDNRSDIFSTGILLYEVVTGKRMFEGDSLQALAQVRDAKFEPPESAAPDLSAKLYEILHRALAKQPDQRYQSAGEMLSDLEEYMYQEDLRPTARGLAQYMKGLFGQDILDEERFMRETMQINLLGDSVAEAETQHPKKVLEKTRMITLTEIKTSLKKRKLWYVSLTGVTLVLLGSIFFLSYKNKPTSETQRMASISTKPYSDSKTSPPVPSSKNSQDGSAAPHPDKVSMTDDAGPDHLRRPSTPDRIAKVQPVKTEPTQLQAALAALKKKNFEKASALFEESLSGDPDLVEKVSGPYAQSLVGQALTLSAKAPEEAKSLLLKAVKLDPRNVRAHFELASLYAGLEDYPKAIETYHEVSKLDPQFPEAFFNLAYIYAVQEDYAKSEDMYKRVVELAPPYLDEVLFNLAVVQEKQGKKAKSIENLERSLALNPDNRVARSFLLRMKEK
ncbi:MAG: protein kinase [Desulfobacteraceae bacterium]|jgi:serine/threonine protein kinase